MKTVASSIILSLGLSFIGLARPNVIVVMTDDQGYPELSVNGNPILETPHLDRLHSESLRLEDYHVSPMWLRLAVS